MVLKEEDEGFFDSSEKSLCVLEAADHELNFVKSSVRLCRMEENGCCFDNYYNKKKVKLQLIEDNRLNKHPESHGFSFQLTSFVLFFNFLP